MNRSKETGVDTAHISNKMGIIGKTKDVKPAGISELKGGSI
jgi:hypothetical protein